MCVDSIVLNPLGHWFYPLALVVALCGGCEPTPSRLPKPPLEPPIGLSQAPPEVVSSEAPPPSWRCLDDTVRGVWPAFVGVHPDCPEAPPPLSMARGAVRFTAQGITVDVELADTPETQERGMMFRRSVKEMRGMLFVFDERRVHTFWMRDTCIALDLLFLDHDGVVVGIVENAAPMRDNDLAVTCPSQYVLEVGAGWARRNGVNVGDDAEITRRPRGAVER